MSKFYEFSQSRLIPVPASVIWGVTNDPGRNHEWCNNVQDVHNPDGLARIGNTFTETSVVAGQWTTTTTWTIVTIEPNSERTFTGGGFPGFGEVKPFLRFRALTDSAGNEHTYTTYGSLLQPKVGPLNRAILALLRPVFLSEFAVSLENLEAVATQAMLVERAN